MANSMFDQFKATMALALQDQDFLRKNEIFQDDDYLADQLSRVQALTEDVSIRLDFDDIISTIGMVEKDTANRRIRFDPKGFETTLSAFREGTITEPKRFWRRDGTDGVRYLLSDKTGGVLLLNQSLEMLRRFPHFGTNVAAGDDYEDAADAVTFTVGTKEYVAIASQSHHVVRIYEYDSPFARIADIGTPDTPGDTAVLLNLPTSIAVDETNDLMFIACQAGTPTGATLDRGFITIFDISTPASPVAVDISHFYSGTGSLLDAQIDVPTDIFFDNDSGLLWISNATDEVGGFTMDTANSVYSLSKLVEPAGPGYTLRTPEQVYVQTLLGGFKRIYIANGATGTIEEFDHTSSRHLATYGFRASEDELNLFTRLSPAVYGAIGNANGVVADRVLIDDQEADVLVVADTLNKRLQRFNLNAYSTDNFANFRSLTFDVPVSVNGWTISGTVPLDMVKVFYKFLDNEKFRELPQETTIPPSSTLQFRVAFQLDPQRFLADWNIFYLRIHGQQA